LVQLVEYQFAGRLFAPSARARSMGRTTARFFMDRMTGIHLDDNLSQPLHRQIFDQVVGRIRTGAFPPGFRLPPTRTLARELRTHRNTVVRVYEDLEAAGFVTSRVGRGTFVAETAADAPGGAGGVTAGPPADRRPLPWAQLTSRAAEAEPISRFERLLGARSGGGGPGPGGGKPDVINLTRMQPSGDLLPDDLLRRCLDHVMRTHGAGALGYAPREGLPRLREQIVADLARQGVPATPDDVVVTTGSQQALDLLARTLINPGDAFLIDESTYTGALNILAAAGARLIGVPSDDEGPLPGALERLERSDAKGFYLMPNHNNPTGRQISAARREALVAWSHRAGIPLIEDDYAADLNLDGLALPPALRALDGEAVYMSTFSKRLIPGLRIGFLVCPAPLRARVCGLKQTTDLCTSPILQHALAEFLERGYLRAHVSRIIPEYRRRRDALEKALAAHLPGGPPRLEWRRPEVGVTLWLRLPPPYTPEAVFEEAQRQGVLISPSTLSSVDPLQNAGVRLVYCAEPPARLAEGARRLGQALAAVTRRHGETGHHPPQTIGIV
jgi:GntR family transcriptional regulator/MocR family aminotransferase